jgi:hypothetical protein
MIVSCGRCLPTSAFADCLAQNITKDAKQDEHTKNTQFPRVDAFFVCSPCFTSFAIKRAPAQTQTLAPSRLAIKPFPSSIGSTPPPNIISSSIDGIGVTAKV